MSSRMTMILAGFFLLAAVLAAYWGVYLSRPPAPVPAPAPTVVQSTAGIVEPMQVRPEEPLRVPVVVLRKSLPAYTALSEEDVVVERLQVAPPGAFHQVEQVLGRSSSRPLAAGSWLEEASFQAGGPFARMIRPHERAVAVAVDDVSGAAGQLRPGDYVDVLLFLRAETENPQASAQVILPALRVLSVDQQTGLANDGRPAQNPEEAKARRDGLNMNGTPTVGLAVPQELATHLMLAAQVGTLRLAVRSADERLLARYWTSQDATEQLGVANRELYRFAQLSQVSPPHAVVAQASSTMQIIRGAQNKASDKAQ